MAERRSAQRRTQAVRRAVRVTLAASAGFYPLVYGLHQPEMALYALFAPVALGVLSPVPGSGRQRAAVILGSLPAGLCLVTLGTALAGSTAAATAGVVAVGFALCFAAVAGPRVGGAAPGLQLFYILACFPPYAPETLWQRLAGLTLGAVLLALCERLVLPAAPSPSYRSRLADAEAAAAAASAAAAHGPAPPDTAAALRASSPGLRPSRLPPAERPAGPWRTDRALAQAGAATRRLLEQLARLTETPAPTSPRSSATPSHDTAPSPAPDPSSAGLLRLVASVCAATAASLRSGRPAGDPDALHHAMRDFQDTRIRRPAARKAPDLPELRHQAAVLAVAGSADIARTAVMVAVSGRRTLPIEPRELFWYADAPALRLWFRRLAGNTTLGSVMFQNAARTAIGLGAARLVAGSLDLTHGFWVLLAVLTLGRTTAGETWTAVRSALAGTLVGALAAGVLLYGVGHEPHAYAGLLAPAMLAAFSLGPLLGVAWAQGLFTLVVATAFAQLAPASWQLAEARIVDVLAGSVIGLACGLLAWPAGARREVRRSMAALLRATAPLAPATVGAVLSDRPATVPRAATWHSLHRLRLAEAAYAQYRSEPDDDPARTPTDWHSVLLTAQHVLIGAHQLPRYDRSGTGIPPAAADWARANADRLADATRQAADRCEGRATRPLSGLAGVRLPVCGPALPVLVDLEQWLDCLAEDLRRIAPT
ncbi:FUSC family protein [Streptomyces pristinaespiralis]|uniref:FUSC family protein n=1 Tax=Streptomyces pristinaespiralis TaxID=38300 RepID=UPI0037AD8D14